MTTMITMYKSLAAASVPALCIVVDGSFIAKDEYIHFTKEHVIYSKIPHSFNFDSIRIQNLINSTSITMPIDVTTEDDFDAWLDSISASL